MRVPGARAIGAIYRSRRGWETTPGTACRGWYDAFVGSSNASAPPAVPPEILRVVRKHHGLVRLSHWANVPLLLGLIASGLSIYWAAPVFHHPPDPMTGSRDYLKDLGAAAAGALHDRGADPRLWIYNHLSLGAQQLATALRLHWALAYLFMLNGLLYAIGLAAGGGWRALLPRGADVGDALRMVRF